MSTPWPVTITTSRYGGTYEHDDAHDPVDWLAWPLPACNLPDRWDAGDLECRDFWDNYKQPVGRGMTPNEALADLEKQVGWPPSLPADPAPGVSTDARD